jgi:hypothetical protein
VPAGSALAATVSINSNPLVVKVTDSTKIQIFYAGDTAGQVYPATSDQGSSGTWIGVDNTVYEPSNFTVVSQTPVTGSGASGDPFTVVSTLALGQTGIRLVESVRVVNGNPYFRIDRRIENTGSAPKLVRVFHYADLYLRGSDSGFGYFDPATRAIGGNTQAADFFQAFIPITPALHYMEGRFSVVRDAVAAAALGSAPLPDTLLAPPDPANVVDNGAALQWEVTVPAGSAKTISDFWSFGVTPQIPPVQAPPQIDSARSSASSPPGLGIVIRGINFGAAQGTGTLLIDGVPAPVAAWTEGEIQLVLPARVGPGAHQVVVTQNGEASDPHPLTVTANAPNLANTIPSPRTITAGPTRVTAPSQISLRSLRTSRCIKVVARSRKPARVLVTIFSGRRSIRVFGQKDVIYRRPGTKIVCIPVPRRAHTFNIRTPLRFAVGWKLGDRPVRGEPSPRPVIRPIRLVP